MALETATFISDLVVTNPAHTDGLNNADAHTRLIKSAIKATFPNINGAVSSSQTQLDAAVTASVSGSGVLKDTGEFFKTNSFDGVTNPARGKVDIVGTNSGNTASVVVAEFNGNDLSTALKGAVDVAGNATVHGNETVAGTLAVTGSITGPGTVPVGGMIMWLDDTLPADGGGVAWCWANGGTLSRTTAGAGLELFNKWGTRYGAGDGATTFNVINMQEVVPVGKSGMGGATSPGLLASISSALKGVLNGIFGSDTHTLTAAEIPTINSGGANNISVTGNALNASTTVGQLTGSGNVAMFGFSSSQSPTPVTSTGSNNISVASTNTGGGAHSNLQPTRAVNFIIRIA